MTHMHYLILILNALPVYLALKTFKHLRRCPNAPHLKTLIAALLFAVAFKSLWFVGLQIDWVINNYDSTVGQESSFAWMLFDFWNAFINLCFVLIVRVSLKWRCITSCDKPDWSDH